MSTETSKELPEREESFDLGGQTESGPVFIVGANRSGTTLLRLMLNAHSRIAIPDELTYFSSVRWGAPIEQWRAPAMSRVAFEQFTTRFIERNCRVLDGIDRVALRETILAEPPNFRTPYVAALESWMKEHGKARWGEKTPGNLFYADVLYEMFPDARFILLVRDPRAGVASMQKVTFFSDDLVFNALSRRKHMGEGRRILEAAVPADRRMTLRYEDLLADPESALRRVCSFVGEAYEDTMLNYHVDARRYMKREAAELFNEAATKPIDRSTQDKWRAVLGEQEVAAVETICSATMKEFGYEPSGVRPTLATRCNIGIKKAYWGLQLWRHRRHPHYTVKHALFERFRSRIRVTPPPVGLTDK